MKFLYPIKKLNIKPWIKYWILKKGLNPIVLSDLIEGTTPITIEKAYEGTTLQELAFKGQTIQEGTPSPEAPIPVQVVKEDNYININEDSYRVDFGSKNKLNFQYSNLRNLNRATTSEETNGFKLTSTGVVGYGFASLPIDNNLIGKQITISCTSTGNKTPSARLFYHNASGSLASNIGGFWTTNNAHTVTLPSTLPSGATGIDIVFYISQANNAEGDYATFTNIMINEDSSALPYESYYDYELCKIGDYQDRIYKENDKWYIEKQINKVILNGTETWKRTQVSASSSYAFWNQFVNLNIPVGKYGQKYCNNFEYQEKIWEQSTPNHLAENNVYTSDLSILFNVDSTIATTVADWKTWLTNNNTTVYYVLATPTYTEITDTNLIEQLEAIKNATLISGTNEITQQASDLPFILNFKYYMKG